MNTNTLTKKLILEIKLPKKQPEQGAEQKWPRHHNKHG